MVPRLVPEIEGGYPERDIGAEGQGWGDSRRLMVERLYVCHVFASFAFPLPCLPNLRERAAFHSTFDYKLLHSQHIMMMMRIVKMMMMIY